SINRGVLRCRACDPAFDVGHSLVDDPHHLLRTYFPAFENPQWDLEPPARGTGALPGERLHPVAALEPPHFPAREYHSFHLGYHDSERHHPRHSRRGDR